MDPPRLPLHPHTIPIPRRSRVSEPGDFRRDACAMRESVEDPLADVVWAADALEEFGLQEARDAEGGGGEGDAEGGVGADEEVLSDMIR